MSCNKSNFSIAAEYCKETPAKSYLESAVTDVHGEQSIRGFALLTILDFYACEYLSYLCHCGKMTDGGVREDVDCLRKYVYFSFPDIHLFQTRANIVTGVRTVKKIAKQKLIKRK